ncbi:MAG: hypothetical protein RLZZ444_2571, partial [Pseudomonadota bacterium]
CNVMQLLGPFLHFVLKHGICINLQLIEVPCGQHVDHTV